VAATRKPVIVRKLSRDWYAGYAVAVPGADSPELELLDSSGKLLRLPWTEIKWVCYTREPASGDGPGSLSRSDTVNPERLLRRRFTSRPRIAGVWLRLTLSDGEELEGITANDRSLVDGPGVMLTPPDTRSNTQRVFVPRSSIRELTVLGVIAPTSSQRHRVSTQPELFEREKDAEQDTESAS
jgi:hypothetical protein